MKLSMKPLTKNEFNLLAFPGKPLSLKEFKDWAVELEASTTISLIKAKTKWAAKRKQILRLTRHD